MESSPITLWQIERGKVEAVTDFIFLGFKIIVDGDCSHEIKRCFLLRRKAMSSLDSVLKSRDITLPAKVHIVKATVFPVVMYGCESWTIKKAVHRRIDGFWTVVLEKTLESTLDCKVIKWVNLKETKPKYSLQRLKAETEAPILWLLMWKADSLEKTLMLGKIKGRRRRVWQKIRWLDEITDSMVMSLSKLWEIVKDREAWHAAVHRITKSQTRLWDRTKTRVFEYSFFFTSSSVFIINICRLFLICSSLIVIIVEHLSLYLLALYI